ncbi:MAG: ATP-binding cassette domain-containing protein [Bacilli bacterium]|nr:ATP-binding cassette domain-containing protein [Bacilli bacterium]
MENKEIVLSVKDLRVNFSTDHGYVQAVRGVSFDLYKSETLCIVGESGSGKSVTSKTIMGILAANGRIASGSIMYEGEDLTKVSEDEFHRIRGHKIGMIFQDPLSSLNPIMRIGKQITEAMLLNGNHLKKMRSEITANEFVAYKNAITAYKNELNKGKEAVKFLKSEKKKEIERLKNVVKNESDGKIYALSQDYGLEKVTIKHKYDSMLSQTDNKEEQAKINEEKNNALNEAKNRYLANKKAILDEAKSRAPENQAALKAMKDDFNQKIVKAKAENATNRAELETKYKPIISDAKAKYKEKNVIAKAEVAKAKKQFKQEYLDEINSGVPANEAKKHYISKIRITPSEAKERALKIMEEVGIPYPEKRFRQYPFEFSGGMRQRIVIAIALTADPDILICDEPTTALDVTIQAQILELINRLKAERHMTCIFITHDLGVVANMADRVAVMYAGKIVEYGTEEEIFYDPRHPYTWALLSSIPDVDSKERLDAIPGTPPNLIYPPKGDAFALRSKYAMKIDFKKEPPLFKVSDTHYAATWLLDPRAPKVEMPAIVKTRIETAKAAHKARMKEAK